MIDEFLQYLQYEKNYSPHTVLSYHSDLLQFCRFLETSPEDFSPNSISPSTLQQWMLSLINEGVTARSISRKISTLKSFWHFMQLRGVVDKNPTTKLILPKTKKPLPAFYKQQEMEAALSEEREPANSFEAVRNRMIIDLFYETGMRVSELVSLKDSSFNFAAGEVRLTGKGNKERIIPLGREICQKIAAYQKLRNDETERQNDWLFVRKNGLPMYRQGVYKVVHCEMSEVSTLHKQSPHVLRHTFATTLLNNGADINAVKKLLGHSSLAATQVYTHVSFNELNKIYKQAHPRATKKGGQP